MQGLSIFLDKQTCARHVSSLLEPMGAVSKMAAMGAGLAVTQAFVAPTGRQQSTSMRGTGYWEMKVDWGSGFVKEVVINRFSKQPNMSEFIELLACFIHDLLRCWEYFLGYLLKRLNVCGLRWKRRFGHIRLCPKNPSKCTLHIMNDS